jgi:hypothetical protein
MVLGQALHNGVIVLIYKLNDKLFIVSHGWVPKLMQRSEIMGEDGLDYRILNDAEKTKIFKKSVFSAIFHEDKISDFLNGHKL